MRRAVLIVEDDDIVREFLVKVLEREGHEVLTASSVEAARSVIFARPDAHNLSLVIDVVLHQESGIAFAQELVTRYPGFRVLLISGFTDDILLSQPEDVAQMGFLAKPFTQSELISALEGIWS